MAILKNYGFLSSFLSDDGPDESLVATGKSQAVQRIQSLKSQRLVLETVVGESSKDAVFFPGSPAYMEHFLWVHSGINCRNSNDLEIPHDLKQPLAETLFWSQDDCLEFLAYADLVAFILVTDDSEKLGDKTKILASWLANALIVEGSSSDTATTQETLEKYKAIFKKLGIGNYVSNIQDFLEYFEFPISYITDPVDNSFLE
jgi:hypothetical protein